MLVTAGQQDRRVRDRGAGAVSRPGRRSARPVRQVGGRGRRALEDLPAHGAPRRANGAGAADGSGVSLAAGRHSESGQPSSTCWRPTRVAPRIRGDPDARLRRRRFAGQGASGPAIIAGDAVANQPAPGASWRRWPRRSPRRCMCEFVPSTASFPLFAPAVPRRRSRAVAGRACARCWTDHDLLFSVGGDLLRLVAAFEPSSRCPRHAKLIHLDTDPWQIGKSYPARGRHPRRPQGHACPTITAAVRARMSAGARRPPAAARLTSRRPTPAKCEREALSGEGALARRQDPGACRSPCSKRSGRCCPGTRWCWRRSCPPNAGRALADRQQRRAELLRPARRRHRLEPARPRSVSSSRCPIAPSCRSTGDGSALYTAQGLWTAAHSRVPVTWVIFNNTSYRILKQRVLAMRGRGGTDRHFRRHGTERSAGRFRRHGALVRRSKPRAQRP